MWHLIFLDIKLIVYRYIHQSYVKQLNKDYYGTIGQYWNDDDDYFYRPEPSDDELDDDENIKGKELIMLNYRDINDEYIDNAVIYKFLTDTKRNYKLSPNYAHASLWQPKLYNTHKRLSARY